jgi:dephospho-CoA kinase
VKALASKDPNVIIQVGVPLLFEVNLQYMFHKTLMVYVPQEIQIERLMKRDGISREMALKILATQWPIEEKKGYADFIIDNSGSLDVTRRQVEDLWGQLKKIQRERASQTD